MRVQFVKEMVVSHAAVGSVKYYYALNLFCSPAQERISKKGIKKIKRIDVSTRNDVIKSPSSVIQSFVRDFLVRL